MRTENLIVFVHGIGANASEWWGSTRTFFENDPELLLKGDLDFYEYKTSKLKNPAQDILNGVGKGEVYAGIFDLGGQLITHLSQKNTQYDNIILFGHSMGGLVIATAIIHANQTPIFYDTYNKISAISLCGTPLGGSKIANIGNMTMRPFTTQQTKDLLTDSENRQDIVNNFEKLVSLQKDTPSKIYLEFIKIPEDEVVSDEIERYGPFLNDVERNGEGIQLKGGHNDAVQNLTSMEGNYKAIRNWVLQNVKSPNSIQNSLTVEDLRNVIQEELHNMCSVDFFKNLSYKTKIKIAKQLEASDDYIKLISNIDKVKVEEQVIQDYHERRRKLRIKENNKLSEEEIRFLNRNYITLKKSYIKTYLSNGMYILDVNNKIKIMDHSQNCKIIYYHGFDDPTLHYHELKYRKNLQKLLHNKYIKLFESENIVINKKFNRFKSEIFLAKRKESDGTLKKIENVTFTLHETPRSKGIMITVDLGKKPINTILEVVTSITLPTEKTPDMIKFARGNVETEIIIQEEIYGASMPKIEVAIEHNEIPLGEDEINRSSNLYYQKTSCHFLQETNLDSNYSITVSKI